MNPFISEFKKTAAKAIERYAKELGKEQKDVQLLFGIKEDGSNLYKLLNEYKSLKEITFNNILGVKIDFSGRSMIVPGYIREILTTLAQQNEIAILSSANVIVYKEKEEVKLYLYKDTKPVKLIDLEELFG